MGGGGFLSDWDPAVPKGWLKQFRLARLLGKRTLLYGIGAGPFKTAEARKTVAHYLNNYVEKITVRDHASYDCLVRDCKVDAALVDIKVDPVAKMNVTPYCEKDVARTQIGIIYTKYFDRPIFGEAQSQWPVLFDCFVEQIRTVQEKNLPVKLIFFQSEIEQDLAEALKSACHVEAVYPNDYKEAIREMSSCKGIISFRLHGNILAYAMGLPFLPIVYHHKGLGFLEMTACSEKYRPIVVGDGINLPKQPLDKTEWRRATNDFLLDLENHD
jgi:polysaccharide pyruvyl transferase WcaK-like protein